MIMISIGVVLAGAVMQTPPPSFDYDKARPVDVQLAPADVTVRQLTYAQLDGTRNAATLVLPAMSNRAPHPAILFLHWYEPPKPTSIRT
jgi:hypothetical protein